MKALGLVVLVSVLTGCASAPQETVNVGSHKYTVSEDGSLQMSKADIQTAIEEGGAVFINKEGKTPYLKLTEKEFKAAAADHKALYTMLDIEPKSMSEDGEIVTLVKEGSLRDNLSRILKEQGWSTLDYEIPDYHITEPYVVKGKSVVSVLDLVTRNYPVFYCADEQAKIITIIPSH